MDLDRGAGTGRRAAAGHRARRLERSAARRWRPQSARANCVGQRIRSTPSLCAYVGALRHPPTRRRHDLRRRRDGVHRHADAAAGPDSATAGSRRPARCATPSPSSRPDDPRSSPPPTNYLQLVTTLLDDAGINYLSVTARTKSVASFAEKADRASTGSASTPTRSSEITDQVGLRVITYPARRRRRRSRRCSPRRCNCSTTATWARRPRARAGGVTPAGICWSASRANSSPRRSRCAPCCSTRGRSSSTTSATRGRFPRRTRPIWIDGSRWRRGCSNSPTASSPPSASG